MHNAVGVIYVDVRGEVLAENRLTAREHLEKRGDEGESEDRVRVK